MPYVAGIDIGSGMTKAVVLGTRNGAPALLGSGQHRTGVHLERAAARALDDALALAGIGRDEIVYIATTGFGRYGLSFRDIQITEITSAGRGARFFFPLAKCVLDIGAQSTRALFLDDKGKVRQFKTNAKCASGSGSFITRAAKYLETDITEIGDLAMQATRPQPISSVCAVLAESEIINHVSSGASLENIVRGIYDSLADRAAALLRRVGMTDEIVFIGGVARQAGMVQALRERLEVRVLVPEEREMVCATGAALLGLQRWQTTRASAG